MAKKIISYKLNPDGTIPDFVEDGGYLVKDSHDTSTMTILGVSKDNADLSAAESEFADEASALAYVSTYLSDSTRVDPFTGDVTTFVVADAVSNLFAKL
jgi:hypothetical protein